MAGTIRTHRLKIWPPHFQRVVDGLKTAEYRFDDRGFREGDLLILEEWTPETRRYTGRDVWVEVTDLIRGVAGAFGIPAGYVVMSIRVVLRGRVVSEFEVAATRQMSALKTAEPSAVQS